MSRTIFDAILDMEDIIRRDQYVPAKPRYTMSWARWERLRAIHAAQAGCPVTAAQTELWADAGCGDDLEALAILAGSVTW